MQSLPSHLTQDMLFYEENYQTKNPKERTSLMIRSEDTSKETIHSSEFNIFHMASPELERLIVGQETTNRETSTINTTDLNVLSLVSPDFEQIFSNIHSDKAKEHEVYTRTFVDALHKDLARRDAFEKCNFDQPNGHSGQQFNEDRNQKKIDVVRQSFQNGGGSNNTFFENKTGRVLADGNQNRIANPEMFKLNAHVKLSREKDVPSGAQTFPLPPIDLGVQEIVKRERKKQKNRVAASKCRKKKLEREAQLEVTVQQLRDRNIELNSVASRLRGQLTDLKQQLMEHVACGCHVTTGKIAY